MSGTAPFWVGTSWKMNKTVAEAEAFARAVRAAEPPPDVRLFVVPPFTSIGPFRNAMGDAPVMVGAQTMHWESAGAFTGEISPVMLRDVGADLVELGHSERRALFGETDERVSLKVRAALAHGLRPLICIGETAAERDSGVAVETVVRQARIALAGLEPDAVKRCLLAYEPVWAIGSGGTPAKPSDAAAIHAALRRALAGRSGAARLPILYGGSVNAENAAALAAEPDIDGLFIGRAAWDAAGFLAIVGLAAEARAANGT
ncbi:MAG: triose-phosphate isomerase [Inquilinaceae bacterium]